MNKLLQRLTGGNLLSDGESKEVAGFVLVQPMLLSLSPAEDLIS
jgi:hypothetical protein